MGSLDGLLVVSLEQAVAAPFLSSRLADAGARVIKIERPEGDFARNYDNVVKGNSAYFVWLNRGKESIAMDLRRHSEIRLLKSMLEKAVSHCDSQWQTPLIFSNFNNFGDFSHLSKVVYGDSVNRGTR